MALLAKYYLSCSSPMGGFEHDSDLARRRTYHADGAWRPSLLAQNHSNLPTSAPTSPRISRKTTWHTTGSRGSCDNGESFQPVNHPPRRAGSVRLSATSSSCRRTASVRRTSPLHARRDIIEATGAASAPTSPHFGIDKSDPSTRSQNLAARGDKSIPSSPSQHSGDHLQMRQSPPIIQPHSSPNRSPKNDSLFHRRSRYAMQRRSKQNQSFAGLPATAFNTAASSPSSDVTDCQSLNESKSGEEFPLRRRCASGPLNEEDKIKTVNHKLRNGPDNEYQALSHQDRPQAKVPELLIALSYSKNLSFVTVTINKARNLPENSSIFVRLHLYEGFKPISMKQTSIIIGGADAEFKQAFMFSLSKDGLWATHMLIELFEQDNECKYGDIVLGPKAGGTGFMQWRQMCTHPNIPCSMWHSVM